MENTFLPPAPILVPDQPLDPAAEELLQRHAAAVAAASAAWEGGRMDSQREAIFSDAPTYYVEAPPKEVFFLFLFIYTLYSTDLTFFPDLPYQAAANTHLESKSGSPVSGTECSYLLMF